MLTLQSWRDTLAAFPSTTPVVHTDHASVTALRTTAGVDGPMLVLTASIESDAPSSVGELVLDADEVLAGKLGPGIGPDTRIFAGFANPAVGIKLERGTEGRGARIVVVGRL